MSDVQIEEKEKNVVKLSFVVTQEEAKPYLEEAARRLSEQTSIPGFRPGKAGYDIVKDRVGEMKILEEALESIVRKSFIEAVLAKQIDTIGSPTIDVSKLAPENDIIFTAEVTRMPRITTLADFKKLSIDVKKVAVEEKDIDFAIKDLQRMQTTEVRATEGEVATDADKLVVSMNMKKEGVPIEGGQSPNHIIFMPEDYYIPGLKKEVKGMKEGETKNFTLKFPKEHVQKMLAGSEIEFDVTLKELFHLESPKIDDAFAVSIGLKDVSVLRETIQKNLLIEKEQEETFRQEKAMLELLAENSRFEEIPDLLLNEEVNKMIAELQHNVEKQGMEFETYVKNMKKTLAQIKLDFTPQALTRLKVALLIREIAKQEKVEVTDTELDTELDRLAGQYEDKKVKDQIYSPQYRDYTEQMVRNKKVIDVLRTTMIK